jgi:prophage maintenance system killer protein
MEKPDIIIYDSPNGDSIEVSVDQETVWLDQYQLADLFQTDRTSIVRHIKNIYASQELSPTDTSAEKLQEQQEGKRKIGRRITRYNLDMIISVGYRVNSARSVHFRRWATAILKNYLVRGYAHNEKLLQEKQAQLDSLRQAVVLITNVTGSTPVSGDQAAGLLRVLTDYTYALDVLDKYDHQVLELEATSPRQLFQIGYASAMEAIGSLRDKFGGSTLFGNEKDESFQGSLAAIYQTFGGVDLYPSVEEKAANLLYFVIKNHSFSDGNKRIAAFLFVWFLEKNAILYRADGSRKLADNALVALTLMIAESKPDEKDMMTRVVVSLVNGRN